MTQEQRQMQGFGDLPEDARKFIVETKQKLSAAKRRCPVCKQKTPHEKLAFVQGEIVPVKNPLGPVTLKLVMGLAEIPFVEYCTKCGNAPLDPKFLEKQVCSISTEFQKKKRMIELGIDPRKLPITPKPEDTGPPQSGSEKRTPSGLIISERP